MECELGKYEGVTREMVDKDGNKAKIRQLKLSLYLDVHEFPDVTSYDGAKLYLYKEQPTGENPISMLNEIKSLLDAHISNDMRIAAILAKFPTEEGVKRETVTLDTPYSG